MNRIKTGEESRIKKISIQHDKLFYLDKFVPGAVNFYLRILHHLRIILPLGCKVFISASPRMQWFCILFMKNSDLDSKVCS